MSIFDFLRGEFIDVIHWTDDTRDTIVWRFEREGHAIKYGAKLTVREGQAAVFVHEGQLADVVRAGALRARDQQPADPDHAAALGPRLQEPVPERDLLRQHPPLHRPEVGDAEPDHVPGQGVRHGAAARLRHLHHAGDRPGEVPDRDRRHRRRVHHRGDRVPDPQHHRHPLQPDHRHERDPGARHGGEHHRPRQDRARPDRADGGGVRAGRCRRSTSRTSRCRPRSRRRWTSGPPPGVAGDLSKIHRVLRRRGDDQGGGQPRRRRRASAPGSAPAWAWRWPSGWRGPAPGARRAGAARRRRQRRRRRRCRARSAGTSRSTARRPGPMAATSSGAWSRTGTVTARQLALDAGRAGLAARPRRRASSPISSARCRRRRPPAERRMELGPVAGAASPAEQHRFPCPTCGADLRFDAGRRACSSASTAATRRRCPEPRGPIPELDLRAVEQRQPAGRRRCEETRFAQCPSCGAQIELGADEHARECPFCASPIVTDTGISRQIKPQAQLPFLLSRGRGAGGDERLARPALVRAERPAAVRPRRAGDAGDLRPLLDLRRRDADRLCRPARHGLLRDPAGHGGRQRPARRS